jgi:HEAT repeat protein/energy-coupling factor transporter ATP-binding protein EcfA2
MLTECSSLTTNHLFHQNVDAKHQTERLFIPPILERLKNNEIQHFEYDAFLHNIFVAKKNEELSRTALIGEPGAGKTTLLQRIALWILDSKLGLPVLVSLPELKQNCGLINLWGFLRDIWLERAVYVHDPDIKDHALNDFVHQIENGRVWLLLDGLDEVGISGVESTKDIALSLRGWIGKVGVLLTCRVNVWYGGINQLSDFETYRLADFTFPKQVYEFIDKWFYQDIKKGKLLSQELGLFENVNIKELAQNPFRLAMVCRIWQYSNEHLPKNQAELYKMIVEQFNLWNMHCMMTNDYQPEKLRNVLGFLSLHTIDKDEDRMLLSKNDIETVIPDNEIRRMLLQTGWINRSIAHSDSPGQDLFSFLHTTFAEYFASTVISNWDFFLPCKHKNKPIKGRRYRVFEPQWKQVILFWFGRQDVPKTDKDDFIKALICFRDGCGNYRKYRRVGHNFYEFRAYFLASEAIQEFGESVYIQEIADQLIKTWLFNKWPNDYNHLDAIGAFYLRKVGSATLSALSKRYIIFIESLLKLLHDPSKLDYIRGNLPLSFKLEVINILEMVGHGNETVINALTQIIDNPVPETLLPISRWKAVEALGFIGNSNEQAISTLIETMHSADNFLSSMAAESLAKVAIGNDTAIKAMIDFIQKSPRKNDAIECLGEIAFSNNGAILALENCLGNFPQEDEDGHLCAARNLLKVSPQNKTAILTLTSLTKSASDDNVRRNAAKILSRIDIYDEEVIFALLQFTESLSTLMHSDEDKSIYWEHFHGNEFVISLLLDYIRNYACKFGQDWAIKILSYIASENTNAISTLTELLSCVNEDKIQLKLIESLFIINPISTTDKNIVNALFKILSLTPKNNLRIAAAVLLGKTDFGKEAAVKALMELTKNASDKQEKVSGLKALGFILLSFDKFLLIDFETISHDYYEILIPDELMIKSKLVYDTLLQESPLNPKCFVKPDDYIREFVIEAIVEMIKNSTDDGLTFSLLECLGKIGRGCHKLIKFLISYLDTFQKNSVCQSIVYRCLLRVGINNESACLHIIEKLMKNTC